MCLRAITVVVLAFIIDEYLYRYGFAYTNSRFGVPPIALGLDQLHISEPYMNLDRLRLHSVKL